jgi:trans-aconitate 2-methyltransferase
MWNPDEYRRFGTERGRAFSDLIARVGATDPAVVADLGCGPGNLTVTLTRRWPGARVHGVDSSAEMISAARRWLAASTGQDAGPRPDAGPRRPDAGLASRLSFTVADVRDWQPARAPDLIVSNAVLQWVPDHLNVLRRWIGLLAPGGWVAVQVPGNFDQPGHQILRELAGSPRWRPLLAGVQLNRQAGDPAQYLGVLADEGCAADVWETTYLHLLQGENPVLRWYRGTGLRPVLAALTREQAAEFTSIYGQRLAAAYPRGRHGTVFPFRRIFAVGHRHE